MKHSTQTLHGKLILAATILASGMAFLDGSVVTIAIPQLQEKLHATITDVQWIVNGYALMLCAFILISGSLGDKFGRKKVFTAGIAIFTFASFLCSISQTTSMLILFRIVQGLGGSMMVPGSLSIIDTVFEDKVRGRAIGIWSGFAGGVGAFGPFLGGYLVQTFGWPSIFYINIPLGILALLLTLKFIPESKSNATTHIDIKGGVLIFLSLLGLSYGLISVPDLGWSNLWIVGSLVTGIMTGVFFILEERKAKSPLVPLKIFQSPLVTGANIATLLLYFALSGVIFFLTLNFQQIQQYSPLIAGLAILPTILLITFLSEVGGVLADKFGPRIPMTIGQLIVGIGMLLLALPGLYANYWIQFLPGLILFGTGMAIVIAPLTKSALEVSRDYSGAASGVNNAVSRVAGLFAVALLGVIMVFVFNQQLTNNLVSRSLHANVQRSILSQKDKLAAIDTSHISSKEDAIQAKVIIKDSFVTGYHVVMGINVILVFISAIATFAILKPKKF